MYTRKLFEIIKSHIPDIHCYADDTQLYMSFKPDSYTNQISAFTAIEACINDVKQWMLRDKLMLNDGKTKFLIIGTPQQLNKLILDGLTIGDSTINSS